VKNTAQKSHNKPTKAPHKTQEVEQHRTASISTTQNLQTANTNIPTKQ